MSCLLGKRAAHLEFSIAHDRTSVLSIKIFLIGHPSTHALLPQHLAKCHRVIISINPQNFACFPIVRFVVLLNHKNQFPSELSELFEYIPSPSSADSLADLSHPPCHARHHTSSPARQA